MAYISTLRVPKPSAASDAYTSSSSSYSSRLSGAEHVSCSMPRILWTRNPRVGAGLAPAVRSTPPTTPTSLSLSPFSSSARRFSPLLYYTLGWYPWSAARFPRPSACLPSFLSFFLSFFFVPTSLIVHAPLRQTHDQN